MVPIEIIVQFSMLFDHDISTNEDIYEHNHDCRHWMNCLWRLKQSKRDTTSVPIQPDYRGSMDSQHHQCILHSVPVIHILLLQGT